MSSTYMELVYNQPFNLGSKTEKRSKKKTTSDIELSTLVSLSTGSLAPIL